ncbi:hypothetical protein [Mesorhizobium sp. M7A.F.Ca.MR.362.00.0.0]|uniref:hypothetical protein n=1 Tax=Mesorhizobium sp. M7A.F.Ca.MR.362.00.0.0 TaxID=2496779 RepID=UPI000FD268F4|nr:hypothetical protein [Mesorhizobium sp. M7A.F.Ca.MR.362.00.0.0]RUU77532.1 hypothetical protein EOC06_23195 [Mesorhizobium sp. M7A.F.Ca.MR.362.00.0.0]RWN94977.1 MAG: hypothetical protein EOS05_09205 [Mesorhizobium sp.]
MKDTFLDNNDNYSIYNSINTSGILVCVDDIGKMKNNFIRLFAIAVFLSSIFLFSYQKTSMVSQGIFIFVITALLFIMGLSIYRTYFKRRSVVISPDGIEDSGITTETVPWSAVNAVELRTVTRALTGQQPLAVLLLLKPGAGDALKLTRRGRKLFLHDNALWIPVGSGMIVAGNPSSPESFSKTIEAYARIYGKGGN